MDKLIVIIIFTFIIVGIGILRRNFKNKKKLLQEKLNQGFPELWRITLEKRVLFYMQLNKLDRGIFENRIQLFLATKNIEGIDTEVDDTIRLMVASSAIIPTFVYVV